LLTPARNQLNGMIAESRPGGAGEKPCTDPLSKTENRIREYDEERPHDSLEDLTPWEYRMKPEGLENSNYPCN
jgi:hypothetical protein